MKMSKNYNKFQRVNKEYDEFEVRPRHGSQQWLSELNKVEGLPVKENGSIKHRYKQSSDEQNDDGSEEENNREKEEVGKRHKKANEEEIGENDDDMVTGTISKHIKSKSLEECKSDIAAICISATTFPEKSLLKTKKNKNNIDDDGDLVHYFPEIFQYMLHPNPKVVKVSILSSLLVFKDIIPGYRIRTLNENSSKVAVDIAGLQLKKETKRLQDHELAVVRVYRRYINFLEEVIHKKQPLYNDALRCECELIKAVSHFNYRNILLHTIIGIAVGMGNAADMCRDTMSFLFKNDKNADLSYEMVIEMNKVFASTKYNVNDEFLRLLEHIKITIHTNQVNEIRKKAKQEKRKRKRETDGVEADLMEASATTNTTLVKRFQADTLHELILIYFRIIKNKIGYKLVPAALDGLSRISHLINIDTAEDLIVVMRNMLTSVPPPPDNVKLSCILCALRTLSGPGAELNIDDEVFLINLKNLIIEISHDFSRWDLILECVELSLIKKRETRNAVVIQFVKLLFLSAAYCKSTTVSITVLSLAHSILLRYPRARENIYALGLHRGTMFGKEEEECVDLAMSALRKETANETFLTVNDDSTSGNEGDGSWILTMFKKHIDKRIHKIVDIIMSKDIHPLPLRLHEASSSSNDEAALELLRISEDRMKQLPRKIKPNNKQTIKVVDNLMNQLLALDAKKVDIKALFH